MILTGDYHTHTVFSHGKGTILENALVAQEKGLKEIAISDHGLSHPAFGLSLRKIPKMKKLCKEASEITGINVLLGIESNIVGDDGSVDLTEKNYDDFDTFLAGFHKFILYKPKTFFGFFLPTLFVDITRKKEVPKSIIDKNTKTFINIIKKNPIDAITHINFGCFTDAVEVAKVASDYGTYIELNSKKVHLTDEELSDVVAKTKVNFIIDSDAHIPNRVGEISLVESLLNRVYVDKNRIHNIEGRVPDFRFRRFKEKNQKWILAR